MTQAEKTFYNTAVYNQTIQHIQMNVKVTLAEVMGDTSPEMLNDMAAIFLEDALPLIEQLKAASSTRNFAVVSAAVHALKGSSSTIGLQKFAAICLDIETSIRQQKTAALENQIGLLEAEYCQIEKALSGFLL